MTKKEMFQNLANLHADNAEIVAFCNHEIELLESRSTHKTPTKTQKENESIMETIMETLGGLEEPVTVSELMATNETLGQYTNQKISALLRKLYLEERVTKITEKGKTKFSV